jgi:hypothetical protein
MSDDRLSAPEALRPLLQQLGELPEEMQRQFLMLALVGMRPTPELVIKLLQFLWPACDDKGFVIPYLQSLPSPERVELQHRIMAAYGPLIKGQIAGVRHFDKQKRDRKSSPAIVRRNLEICDLRRLNPDHWSQARLAQKYKITKRAVQKILADEEKWRRQAGGATN